MSSSKMSTGKEEQVDTGFFYLLKLSSNKKKISFQLKKKEWLGKRKLLTQQ